MTRRAHRSFNAGVDFANPIYDVVFKYLMQNHRVARLLIGRITGLAVQSLTVSPQETAVRPYPGRPRARPAADPAAHGLRRPCADRGRHASGRC